MLRQAPNILIGHNHVEDAAAIRAGGAIDLAPNFVGGLPDDLIQSPVRPVQPSLHIRTELLVFVVMFGGKAFDGVEVGKDFLRHVCLLSFLDVLAKGPQPP